MPVIAANTTAASNKLLAKILHSKKFLALSHYTDLNLQNNSVFLRMAIINLIKNTPSERDVESYKASLLNLREFDNFMRDYPKRRSAY